MINAELYNNRTYFKLKTASDEYFVDEPGTWDKIFIQNLRDKDYFGFIASFVDEKQQLEFASDKKAKQGATTFTPAYDIVKSVYDNEGGDGRCELEFGIVFDGDLYPQYNANLNFNTYHNEDGSIKCSVEKLNFNDLFRTRFDTSVSLSNTITLDSELMDLPASDTLLLKSKLISKQYVANVTSPETAESGSIARFLNIQPDTSAPQISELEEGEGLPLGISGIDPRDEQRYFFKAIEAGNYIFDFKVSFALQIVRQGFAHVGTWNVVPRFMIQRQDNATATVQITDGQISGGSIIGAILTDGGSGYTYCTVDITGDGAGATAVCAVYGGAVVSVSITNGGQNYTNATLTFTGDGTDAAATISDGTLTGLTITHAGFGYTNASVEIVGDGDGAEVTANLTAGKVTSFTITNAGSGYTHAAAIITGDATTSTAEYSTFNPFKQSGDASTNSVSTHVNCQINLTRTLRAGDRIYFDFNGTMQTAGVPYFYYVTNYLSNISVTGQTSAEDSYTDAYRLFDAGQALLNAATNQPTALISSVMSEGGRAYNYHITNGYQIRGFDKAFKPVITSLKDYINSVCSIFGLGYGFTTRGGVQYLIIEDIDFFFKDREITRLPNTVNGYYEEHASALTYNEALFGYSKFPTLSTANGTGNTLDEVNTTRSLLFPIKSYKATLTKKSDYIASPYAAETQRREQFKDNPGESMTNDDDIFIFSTIVVDDVLQTETSQSFTSITGVLSPETSGNFRITPMRMFFNWSRYINIGLYNKPDAANIILTLSIDNNTMVSQLKPDDPYRKFEPSFPLREGGTITKGQLTEGTRTALHQPIFSFFKVEMKYDQVKEIMDKQTFSAESDDDGGYIVYPDDKGNFWKGYVYSLKYNPEAEEAEFQVARKGIY